MRQIRQIRSVGLGLLLFGTAAFARDFPQPQRVADGVYVLEGAREHFSRANGGDIANTGFIGTPAGTVVIDTGASLRYGQAQRAAVRAATGHDVVQVYITHAHPDHFLGNQAYADVPVQALPATAERIAQGGDQLAQNLYLLVGSAMAGTAVQAPGALATPTPDAVAFGGRRLQLIALQGHSSADLAVFDEATGSLFAGDLVFFERAPTTADADLPAWLDALDRLARLPVRVLVPGHGPVVRGPEAIAQTRDYLLWVQRTLREAAAQGLDMNEVMRLQAPERLRRLAVLQAEWQRTVMHLYPAVEAGSLPRLGH
ncbi:quinoprotein relay system zinc metallohydrolase 1 [Pseudorhodoferax sp. Leaf265]|uniref:quinoprotein relay system zinc metallohydrolase 1 n=1 Tax=Pseudorhodoferax sp. Leaf265 TaxID=1736315 RepID=UPI0006FBD604|nr:quinoprotein relay system zinc metallohydrolase 1 [Pseudorhodoferax sp. Leaf265]KQP08932.1 MBL fold metallo-hydrolase [Pseudorhodoferax sp. Leaf265]